MQFFNFFLQINGFSSLLFVLFFPLQPVDALCNRAAQCNFRIQIRNVFIAGIDLRLRFFDTALDGDLLVFDQGEGFPGFLQRFCLVVQGIEQGIMAFGEGIDLLFGVCKGNFRLQDNNPAENRDSA